MSYLLSLFIEIEYIDFVKNEEAAIIDQTVYREKLRAYQEAYVSTLDHGAAALKLHEAAVAAIRQAAEAADRPLRRAAFEHRALRALNALSDWIRRNAMLPGADAATCDALVMTYARASLHVHKREYDAAVEAIRVAIR